MWLLVHHLDDVRSDMSVLHRVDHLESMEATRCVSFARRLSAYHGAVAAALATAHAAASAPVSPALSVESNADPSIVHVPATRDATTASPVLASVLSWGHG